MPRMLMLLDSAGLYFRAFHGAPESITGPDGSPVNAVRGFLDMTAALVTSRRPSGLVACWDDDWRPQWRVDLIESYKTHRVAVDGGQDEPETLATFDVEAHILDGACYRLVPGAEPARFARRVGFREIAHRKQNVGTGAPYRHY